MRGHETRRKALITLGGSRTAGTVFVLLSGLLLYGCAQPQSPSLPGIVKRPLPSHVTADPMPRRAVEEEPEDEELFDPTDPWAPFIAEASETFDIPEDWIRAVIHHESGGRAFVKGRPIRGPAGSIGLMQVSPDTFRSMSRKYGLGSDPGDPYDNIMAGTAYLREMYEQFGAPFFLAAYNCGHGCAAKAAAGKRKLPATTRRYLAKLGEALGNDGPLRPDWSIKELVRESSPDYGG